MMTGVMIKGGGSRPAGVPPTETSKVGVLGAGLMGHGIAYITAMAGLAVVLKDVTREKAEAGQAAVAELLGKRVSQGKLASATRAVILGRLLPTDTAVDLQGCDLIIEAVFEDRDLKTRVMREAEAQIAPEAVYGSNTSTMPITGLAVRSLRPANFIGTHFFSPVHRMDLVEIIVGKQTSQQTLAKVFDYSIKIGKTPIVVNDSRGFYTSRVISTYVNEGLNMLAEGQTPQAIEAAGLQAGMPMGALEVADLVGLNLAMHINEQTVKDLAAAGQPLERPPADAVIVRMVKEQGRLGKTAGAGFYDYPKGGGKSLWPHLGGLYPTAQPLPQQELVERLMFIQALETVRCLEEGVVTSVADANLGSVLGWGFPPAQGGSLQYINGYGLSAFVARSGELADKYGNRFRPPQTLRDMVQAGKTF